MIFTKEKGAIIDKDKLWEQVSSAMDNLKDGKYEWALPKKYKTTRSAMQNKYYWGVVLDTIGKELGYLSSEVHELMGKRFLSYTKGLNTFVKSTTKLNTKEMEEYLENVRRFASIELHILVMLPNESEFKYEVK